MSLAFGASLDIVHNIPDKLRPPILSGNKLHCPFDPWMSIYWCCVVSLNDGTLIMESTSDHSLSLLVPGSFYFLEPVGVHPWFEDVLVLLVYRVFRMGVFFGQYLY